MALILSGTDSQGRGFVEEGRLKKMFWIGGAWIDVLNFAMLEEEWFSRTNETRLDKP